MSTRIRSHSKINLGLAIGPSRPDGFHALTTLYQTLELHDLVTVSATLLESTKPTSIRITCNHPGVPTDNRNTAWRMVEKALAKLGVAAEVHIDIDKRLPVQGGLGAGSANAIAALIGLEHELGLQLSAQVYLPRPPRARRRDRLRRAALPHRRRRPRPRAWRRGLPAPRPAFLSVRDCHSRGQRLHPAGLSRLGLAGGIWFHSSQQRAGIGHPRRD